MSENELDKLEAEFPSRASAAFAAAREKALNAGFSVLHSENGVLVEVFPDGRRIERGRVEPPLQVPPGTRFRLR
jgi:hypothetical protein